MPHPEPAAVLDAWPLIERFKGQEPSREELDRLLTGPGPRPVMSTVNFTEVCSTLAQHAGQPAAAQRADILRRLVRVEAPDHRTAAAAAWIKHTYRMSLGDTFAAATAMRHAAELWTGDPELLCADRVWTTRDLRPDGLRQRHQAAAASGARPTGRRSGRLDHLGDEHLAALIADTLRTSDPRRRSRPSPGLER